MEKYNLNMFVNENLRQQTPNRLPIYRCRQNILINVHETLTTLLSIPAEWNNSS